MLHYFPILSILKSTHIKYSCISFLMLLQYYLIEEIFKTLRKSIEREQKCQLIPFLNVQTLIFFCTKRSIVERLNIGRRVFVKSFFKKQDVLEKVITMLKCQLCERISYILWKTRNYFFLSYQSRSFPSLLSLHIKPKNLSPWGAIYCYHRLLV